ncbi:MAG: DHH family phosphoesterase [Microgenomates group bacterium]
MNFPNSKEILEVINASSSIVLSLHISTDPDSIISNLLFKNFLEKLNKKVTFITPEVVNNKFKTMYDLSSLKDSVDVYKNLSDYDLFITLDVNEPSRVGLNEENHKMIKTINIDHHQNLNYYEPFKISDTAYSSTSEMIFLFFEDIGYSFSSEEVNLLLEGIITDTESFSYSSSSRVFKTVSKLIELGANYDIVNAKIYRNNSIDQLKFWSKGLSKIKVDKKHKFSYIALSLKDLEKYKNIIQGTRSLADKFVRTVEGTNFGMVIIEREEGGVKISVRSRVIGYGLTKLLKDLNGGGHFDGGGGQIDNMSYKDAVKTALKITRKFAKEKNNNDSLN